MLYLEAIGPGVEVGLLFGCSFRSLPSNKAATGVLCSLFKGEGTRVARAVFFLADA